MTSFSRRGHSIPLWVCNMSQRLFDLEPSSDDIYMSPMRGFTCLDRVIVMQTESVTDHAALPDTLFRS